MVKIPPQIQVDTSTLKTLKHNGIDESTTNSQLEESTTEVGFYSSVVDSDTEKDDTVCSNMVISFKKNSD